MQLMEYGMPGQSELLLECDDMKLRWSGKKAVQITRRGARTMAYGPMGTAEFASGETLIGA
jgi:hypothetical protein